jgi:hypothetical protein
LTIIIRYSIVLQAHAWKWDSIARFEENCGYLSSPISTQELQMHSCLKDGTCFVLCFNVARLQMSKNVSIKSNLRKCTKILGKVLKRFKILVIIYMLCVINDRFLSIYNNISTALLTQ